MPRFFICSSDISSDGKTVEVRGDDAVHITRVLRMRPGERLTLCDECGREYMTSVCATGESVLLEINSSKTSDNEPPYSLTVYQALVKGDRFDTVLQKSTELGATEFVPMITSRCIVSIDRKEYEKKLSRWQRIVYEASKQCGRGKIPTVKEPIGFFDAVERASSDDLPLFCYEGTGTTPLSRLTDGVPTPASVSVVIGPEGGFSNEEAQYASEHGLKMTGLGNRILRTETAAPFVLSCLCCRFEL